MSEKKSCETCKHFYQGDCRRYPPQLVSVNDGPGEIGESIYSWFPSVCKSEWCGEYEKDFEDKDGAPL